VLGPGGVIAPHESFMPFVGAICARHDILLIADGVVSGFGRPGPYWGSQTMGIEPDTLTCAKALSAAFLPISAVLIGKKIVDAVAEETHAIGTFGHGFTYSGHPVPAAVALETLKIYDEDNIIARAAETGQFLQAELKRRLAGHPLGGDVRGAGLIAGAEIVADKADRLNFAATDKIGPTLVRLCEAKGVILRSCPNDTIALSPPLIISEQEVTEIIDQMEAGLDLIRSTLRSGKPAIAAA
uniref:aminotransferase class III-fold pyridoxal phosphate-dependent enzyme n=1 Tax=Mesorhizobium sp. GbtcB19 TaxID=2824764 RepID=UPI001C2FBD60